MARKILLADDSVTAQNMGRKILADAGYEVITVNNGSAALKKITEHKPDLIVLDVYMPGYSGLEVCQRLKEVAETARIPVLLTVGKLEPFKTDEAKRVRADGFIVKPFEASELLSALSKLEDKIVPRGESKPGRFARANAVIDEGRDRTATADEDSGWKNRISFPSKRKKEAVAETDGNDPAIYNPVNRDLRTVVEHHAAPAPKEAETERVDLGALAPAGLPKDVTPEEIAALAAAAAQVQGTILEAKAAEQEQAPIETKTEAPVASVDAHATEAAVEPAPVPPAVTFAEQTSEAKAEASTTDEASSKTEEKSETGSDFEKQSWETRAEEPVTMAVAAGAHSGGSASRWTAVAVALAPEESTISLEHEMQRAYAEFAASQAESDAVASTVAAPEPVVQQEPVSSTMTEQPVAEIPVAAAPETPGVVAGVASEAISAAVKEFETVDAPHVAEDLVAEPVSPESPEPAVQSEPEPEKPALVETAQEQGPAAVAEETAVAEEAPQPVVPDLHAQESESPVSAVQNPEPAEVPEQSGEPQISSDAMSTVSSDHAVSGGHVESKESDVASAAWASWRKIRESGDGHEPHAGEPSQHEKSSQSTADAAMAVAAGAEKTPEEAIDFESDPAIASIVDSVLADLRPKIVEEISRKLGKKK